MNETPLEPPDHELISRMQRKEEDLEAAKRAFTIFYTRHAAYIHQHVYYANEQLVGYGVDVEDIVQEAFGKVWLTACYNFSPSRTNADASPTASTRAWLGKIVVNLIRDRLRRQDNVHPIDPGPDNEDVFTTVKSNDKVKAATAIEQLVSNTLSERDAAIVWFKINAYDPDTRKSEPDRDDLAHFCRRWGIKPEALRQVYLRALKTLQNTMATIPQ